MNRSARQLILALRQLNSELSTSNRKIATQTGLNPADLAILDVLHREGAQSATSLARRTVTHLATMTGVLKRLERDGWVVRRPDDDDRRAVVIDNVDSRRLTVAYAHTNRELAALADGWTDEQLALIIDFLDRASATVRSLNMTPGAGGHDSASAS